MQIKTEDRLVERQPEQGPIDWNAIVAENGPMVWQTLWRLLAHRADVEECFQETFLSAFKLSQRETMQCWPAVLCSLATARGIDRLRRRYRPDADRPAGGESSVTCQMSEVTSTDTGPVENAVASEFSARVRVALAQLPEQQAEAFYLHALCGWSHREVGERLDMTENAVGVTIHRARHRLRELLGDDR